jgi:hypothetical protein
MQLVLTKRCTAGASHWEMLNLLTWHCIQGLNSRMQLAAALLQSCYDEATSRRPQSHCTALQGIATILRMSPRC